MLTPSHGLIAWLVGKRLFRSRPEMVKFLVLGSLISDVFMIANGIIEIFKGSPIWEIVLYSFGPWWVKYPTIILHSFAIIPPVLYLLSSRSRGLSPINEKIETFLWGALVFHQGIDFITHGDYGHRHFWPLSDYKFYSGFSSLNKYFFRFDLALSVTAIVLLTYQFLIKPRKRNTSRD